MHAVIIDERADTPPPDTPTRLHDADLNRTTRGGDHIGAK
jgi:hypothetical protein